MVRVMYPKEPSDAIGEPCGEERRGDTGQVGKDGYRGRENKGDGYGDEAQCCPYSPAEYCMGVNVARAAEDAHEQDLRGGVCI